MVKIEKRLLFLVLILTFILSAYRGFFDNDDKMSDKKMVEILNAIQAGDEEEVKALFSADVAMNLDEGIDELENYYKGNYQTIERVGGPNVSDSFSFGKSKKTIKTSYLVTTDVEQYCVYFRWCIESENSNDLGALSFYYKKADSNISMNEPFWGDGLWMKGIHILEDKNSI